MKRLFLLLLLCGFHQPASFEANASDGGGNRMYFDGSPRQKSYDCTACHNDAPRTITAKLALSPAADGAYTPGTAYTITVSLVGEHEGTSAADNQNGFLAEIVDDARAPAGRLATSNVDLVKLIDDGNVAAGEGRSATMWSFAWTAPAVGAGAVTLHVGLVDGNGAASASVPQNDPGGDDVAIASMRLCEGAAGCAAPAKPAQTDSAAAGCNAAGAASPLLVIFALLALRRRRAWIFALLAGCYAPNTPGECPDHVCGGTGADAAIDTCTEAWVCTSWEAPAGSDQATRTCVDTNNRGTTQCKPATSATLPPLDFDYYQCKVHPIFQRGCGQMNCHGTDDKHPFRVYTRGRWRNDELVPDRGSCLLPAGSLQPLRDLGAGTVMCEGWYPHTAAEWKKSFDSSRSFMLDVATPDDSLILREPTKGGLPHAQVKLFAMGDTSYQTIRAWLNGAALGTTCNPGMN